MLEDLQIRHYSPTTIRIYLHAVTEFAQHFGKSPDQLNAEHIRQYQWFLIKEKKVSRPAFIQLVCALRFFYIRHHQIQEHQTRTSDLNIFQSDSREIEYLPPTPSLLLLQWPSRDAKRRR